MSASCKDFVGSFQPQGISMVGCLSWEEKWCSILQQFCLPVYVAHIHVCPCVLEPRYEVADHGFFHPKTNLIWCNSLARQSSRELFHGACAASLSWNRDNLRNGSDLTLPYDQKKNFSWYGMHHSLYLQFIVWFFWKVFPHLFRTGVLLWYSWSNKFSDGECLQAQNLTNACHRWWKDLKQEVISTLMLQDY